MAKFSSVMAFKNKFFGGVIKCFCCNVLLLNYKCHKVPSMKNRHVLNV